MKNNPSTDRFSFLVLGIMMSLFGLLAIFKRGFYSTKESSYIDFGEYHWLFGMLVLALGVSFIYVSKRRPK